MATSRKSVKLDLEIRPAPGSGLEIDGTSEDVLVRVYLSDGLANSLQGDGGPISVHLPAIEAAASIKLEEGDYELVLLHPAGGPEYRLIQLDAGDLG
ncbi:hypothetical protein [Sphingomonas sp. MMS24-J13]|uniref:hypothetical protein n=1 Tax=Sphingomonas sp. MMS24-J13 TaxID=3238686 RepID=UPI00384D7913